MNDHPIQDNQMLPFLPAAPGRVPVEAEVPQTALYSRYPRYPATATAGMAYAAAPDSYRQMLAVPPYWPAASATAATTSTTAPPAPPLYYQLGQPLPPMLDPRSLGPQSQFDPRDRLSSAIPAAQQQLQNQLQNQPQNQLQNQPQLQQTQQQQQQQQQLQPQNTIQQQQQQMSIERRFPVNSAPKKRKRKKYHEVERLYKCTFKGCTKAYGTLNHLNCHIALQKHGKKRLPSEFKDIREKLKQRRRQERRRRRQEEEIREQEAAKAIAMTQLHRTTEDMLVHPPPAPPSSGAPTRGDIPGILQGATTANAVDHTHGSLSASSTSTPVTVTPSYAEHASSSLLPQRLSLPTPYPGRFYSADGTISPQAQAQTQQPHQPQSLLPPVGLPPFAAQMRRPTFPPSPTVQQQLPLDDYRMYTPYSSRIQRL